MAGTAKPPARAEPEVRASPRPASAAAAPALAAGAPRRGAAHRGAVRRARAGAADRRAVAAGDRGEAADASAPRAPLSDRPLIVAIDGPSGVGKSTAARLLAHRLRVPFLDTGAMYRAVGLQALERGVDPGDAAAVGVLAEHADIRLERRADGTFEVLLDGRPVEERIRTREVGEAASRVSEHPVVRRRMVALQREIAGRHGGVLEGRDIGTRVFPETPHKFFLDAAPEVRFRRRHEQLAAAGREASLAEIVEELTGRDRRDSRRTDSPLTRDASYTFIDTSELPLEQVVERMARQVEESR